MLAHDVHGRVGAQVPPSWALRTKGLANVTVTVGKRKAGCKLFTRVEVRIPNEGESDAHKDGRTADSLSKCNNSDINNFSEVYRSNAKSLLVAIVASGPK